jgi:hypothetical protein
LAWPVDERTDSPLLLVWIDRASRGAWADRGCDGVEGCRPQAVWGLGHVQSSVVRGVITALYIHTYTWWTRRSRHLCSRGCLRRVLDLARHLRVGWFRCKVPKCNEPAYSYADLVNIIAMQMTNTMSVGDESHHDIHVFPSSFPSVIHPSMRFSWLLVLTRR